MSVGRVRLSIIVIYPPLDHWIWLVPAAMLGACIGSFLNVVIYRVPLGMSVNEPNRSFCPHCRHAIPMWQNIPVFSWLWLRGKCANCRKPIAFRYVAVEILTALLFALVWHLFPPVAVPFLWSLLALLISITFIDAEHLVIPTGMTWAGCALGLAASAVWPECSSLGNSEGVWSHAMVQSVIGWSVGFFGLWGVVELGKLAFGRKNIVLAEPTVWLVREPEKDDQALEFVIGDEVISWWDVFSRPSDRIRIEAQTLRIDGRDVPPGWVEIRELEVMLPDGTMLPLERLRSLDGTTRRVTVSREAMGFGDVHLLGMIGAFFGWGSVWFSLFGGSLLALLAAIVGRVGFGRPLPFGPFLALGALGWMFGGWKLWHAYWEFLQPLFQSY